MKRQWDIEELIEHFTLVQGDLDLLGNKSGPTRLGFALLLKCFQYEGRFPHGRHEIPKDVVTYVARQLKLNASLLAQYDWEGRTIKAHRAQLLQAGQPTVVTPLWKNRETGGKVMATIGS